MVDYQPERYAFRFPNAFENEILKVPWVTGMKTITTDGRCGGMAFASLDCFHARRQVPRVTPDDFSEDVPPDGHPLADYIWSRQLDSMIRGRRGIQDGVRFYRWSNRSTSTLVRKTDDEQIPAIRRSIDEGEPVVLGLIGPKRVITVPDRPRWGPVGLPPGEHEGSTKLGDNHQVVCYGYRRGPSGVMELLIYEPNEPFEPSDEGRDEYEVVLSKRAPGSGTPYHSDRPGHPSKDVDKWRGFFVQRYRPKTLGPRIGGSDPGSDGAGGPGTDRQPPNMK